MIHSVKSNNPSFKPVTFHSGFNVILADRNHDNESEEKQTRNGAGKTTLVEIIHFCLGSQVTANSVFKNENLKGWAFVLEIDIGNKIYNIERLFNKAAGMKPEDDKLPKRLIEEPISSGPSKGMTSQINVTLPQYYEARGWENAFPTQATLERLGLAE